MKIAHITTIDIAIRVLLLNQLKSLQEAGFEVYGISAPGPEVEAIEAAGIKHIPVPLTRRFDPLADLIALKELYRVLRRERFTIVHTHTPKPGLLGQLAARMAGVPLIVNTIHGFYFHENMSARKQQFYITLEKIAARCSHSILSQNQEDIQTAVRTNICRPEKIQYLGNGIDVRRFDRNCLAAEPMTRLRQQLKLTNEHQVVGFVGRLVREKGIPELLQAAKIILQQRPLTKFLFVGPLDEEKSDAFSPETASEYGIADACIFTGLREDMPELYALMDVFVLPSHREGFPRSPMEASAMRVPSVVTDIRGCREVIENGQNGFLVPLGDVTALAQAILKLLGDPALALRMGEAGRAKALASFDEQLVFRRVKSEYARLLKAAGLTAPTPLLAKEVLAENICG